MSLLRIRRPLMLSIALLLVWQRAALAQPAATMRTGACGTPAHNLYRLCFEKTEWKVDEPDNARFTNRDRVEVEIRHFNFLRYTLSFDVKEEKSESYQYLTKLWSSLLSPDMLSFLGLGGEARGDASLITAMRDVYRRAQALDRKITKVASQYRRTGLTDSEATTLRDDVLAPATGAKCDPSTNDLPELPAFPEPRPGSTLDDPLIVQCPVEELVRGLNLSYARLSRLIVTNDAAFNQSITGAQKTLFTTVTDAYTAVRKRADAFVNLAQKTVGVEVKQAGKHDAGTRVTLAISALDEGGNRSPMADVNFFVETAMPLVVHIGVALSGLRDVTFDTIKRGSTAGEDDLFLQKSASDSSKNFTTFLSWVVTPLTPKAGPNNSWGALLLSLGTDVAAPGKKIFAGPTVLLFNRMALTVGAVFAKEAEGQLQTLEPNVFRIVQERPKATFFFALTSKVH
jgi:hypothetical protein